MRQNLAFIAVLAAAAAVGALLVMPGRPTLDTSPPAVSEVPSAPPAPPRSSRVRQPPPPAPTLPAYVRVEPESATACAHGMVLVDGVYCPYVGHRCVVFEDESRDLCATFAPEAVCEGALQRRRYCIDVYEYPNVAAARPAVWASYDDARRACALEGKRLCAAEEWELACEGTGMWPFPYGLTRDAAACNEHRSGPAPDAARLDDPWMRSAEIARVDGRLVSGAELGCVSPFGVYDLPGNVEEWVEHANGQDKKKPFRTARKGGSWSRGKGRCRPIEASEPGWYRAHDLGFRCCSDAKGSVPSVGEVSPNGGRAAGSRGKKRVLVPPVP